METAPVLRLRLRPEGGAFKTSGWEFGMFGNRQSGAHQPFDIPHFAALIRGGKRNSAAFMAGPGGPADPVNIIFRVFGKIVIYH